MFPHTRNPFDTRSNTRPPAKQGVPEFLDALGDPEAAAAYRKAMGDDASSSTTEEQELTPEELARLSAVEAVLRETREKKDLAALKADYLAWAREFNLGGGDPQAWLDGIFIFNSDGTVEVQGDLNLSNSRITRLPQGLIRVKGSLNLQGVEFVDLDNLPQEIYGNLNLSGVPITTLDGLRGKRIGGDLWLRSVPVTSVPEGIELDGRIVVWFDQAPLILAARGKGYTVIETR